MLQPDDATHPWKLMEPASQPTSLGAQLEDIYIKSGMNKWRKTVSNFGIILGRCGNFNFVCKASLWHLKVTRGLKRKTVEECEIFIVVVSLALPFIPTSSKHAESLPWQCRRYPTPSPLTAIIRLCILVPCTSLSLFLDRARCFYRPYEMSPP